MNSQNPEKPKDFDKAVNILSSVKHEEFIQNIVSNLNHDMCYLHNHHLSIGIETERILFKEGINWNEATRRYYVFRVLRVALERIKAK